MEKYGQIATLITELVDRTGTKFVVTLVTNAMLYWLAQSGQLEGLYAGIGCVAVNVAYLFVRRQQEKKNPKL